MTDSPAISVVIPSWNTRQYLIDCLESLERARKPSIELIVVDNGSHDGSADWVARERPQATLIRNDQNEGFARACNQGMRVARGRYVLLLNTDTVLGEDALERLYDFLEQNPEYGTVAPRLIHADGRTQRTVQEFPNLRTALFFSTPLERWFPNSRELRRYFIRDWDQESSRDVDQPPAACLLVRASVLERVGLFDEELWLFYNDVDLSKRIKADGWKTRYIAEAEVVHHVGASTSKFGGFVPEWQKNRLAYYRKHHGRFGGLWIKACVGLTFSDWALAQFWARLRGRQAEPVAPMARVLGKLLRS